MPGSLQGACLRLGPSVRFAPASVHPSPPSWWDVSRRSSRLVATENVRPCDASVGDWSPCRMWRGPLPWHSGPGDGSSRRSLCPSVKHALASVHVPTPISWCGILRKMLRSLSPVNPRFSVSAPARLVARLLCVGGALTPAAGSGTLQSTARPAAMRPQAISADVGGENLSMRRRLRLSSSASPDAVLSASELRASSDASVSDASAPCAVVAPGSSAPGTSGGAAPSGLSRFLARLGGAGLACALSVEGAASLLPSGGGTGLCRSTAAADQNALRGLCRPCRPCRRCPCRSPRLCRRLCRRPFLGAGCLRRGVVYDRVLLVRARAERGR